MQLVGWQKRVCVCLVVPSMLWPADVMVRVLAHDTKGRGFDS